MAQELQEMIKDFMSNVSSRDIEVTITNTYRFPLLLHVARSVRDRFAQEYFQKSHFVGHDADTVIKWLESLQDEHLTLLRNVSINLPVDRARLEQRITVLRLSESDAAAHVARGILMRFGEEYSSRLIPVHQRRQRLEDRSPWLELALEGIGRWKCHEGADGTQRHWRWVPNRREAEPER